MTQTPDDMPNAPWWSQPGATAVLPLEPRPEQASAHIEPPKPKTKQGSTAVLLALALLAGGGAGGAVAVALDNNGTAAGNGSTVSAARVVGSASDTIKGTPESAAAVISPSVVTVEVSGQTSDQFGGLTAQSDTGSGIIIRSSGYILTNNHVVAAAAGGGSVHVTLSDGKTVVATIIGTDPSIDLAVLKVDGVSGLTAATFADSDSLKVGQTVLAVGAPLGLSNSVT